MCNWPFDYFLSHFQNQYVFWQSNYIVKLIKEPRAKFPNVNILLVSYLCLALSQCKPLPDEKSETVEFGESQPRP
jgi:hypothetical protein